jgi:hypothetical protein
MKITNAFEDTFAEFAPEDEVFVAVPVADYIGGKSHFSDAGCNFLRKVALLTSLALPGQWRSNKWAVLRRRFHARGWAHRCRPGRQEQGLLIVTASLHDKQGIWTVGQSSVGIAR